METLRKPLPVQGDCIGVSPVSRHTIAADPGGQGAEDLYKLLVEGGSKQLPTNNMRKRVRSAWSVALWRLQGC